MSDLNQVEKNAYRIINQDGLFYLFMGFLFGLVGTSFYNPRWLFLSGLAGLFIFPLELLRRRITYPRIGYVRFAPPASKTKGMLGAIVAGIAILILLAFVGNGLFSRYLPIIITLVFTLVFYFAATMQGIRLRDWVVLAVIVSSGFVALIMIGDLYRAVAIQMWITAVLLISIGTYDLIKFMRTYPLIEGENAHE